jgi:ribosomal protein S18
MMVAAKRNIVKAALAKDLSSAKSIIPADLVYSRDVMGRIPKDPKNPELGLYTYMENGKPVHTYVDRAIAELFKTDPTKATMAAQVWGNTVAVLRDVLVSKNPAWQARNVIRDLTGTIKNIEQIGFRDTLKLLNTYRAAYKEAYQEIFKGIRSADISHGYKEYALPDTRVYSAKDAKWNDLVEQRVNEFVKHVNQPDSKPPVVYRQLKTLYDFLDKTGRISELTGKIAGYKYLKQYHPEVSAMERAHLVRTRVGTPDYMRRGAWNSVTNNLFIFSNINKEGIRSGLEAFQANPTRYAWKVAVMNVLPKAAIAGITIWGANTLLGKTVKKIDEYDKRMYTVVPIGLVNDGKDAIYLRIPQDYEGTAISAALWDAIRGQPDEVIRDVVNNNPYNINPIIDVAYKAYQIYGEGINPVDEYRRRNVISDVAMEAGGTAKAKEFGAFAWNSLGGKGFYSMKTGMEIYTDETELQKVLRLPGMTALGSYVRISHNGERSEVYDVIGEVQKQAAKIQIRRKAATVEAVNNGRSAEEAYKMLVDSDLIDPEKTSINEFSNTYRAYEARKSGDAWLAAVMNANSIAERKALFDAMPVEKKKQFESRYNTETGKIKGSGSTSTSIKFDLGGLRPKL